MPDEDTRPGERRSRDGNETATLLALAQDQDLLAELRTAVKHLTDLLDRIARGDTVTVVKPAAVGKSTQAHKIPGGTDEEWR